MNDDSFFSINRLVEFGMSLAVAQQMTKTMNEAISNMNIPGTFINKSIEVNFYYAIIDGNQVGPFNEQEVLKLIGEKKINKETFIWKPGCAKWEVCEKFPEILRLVSLTPPSLK